MNEGLQVIQVSAFYCNDRPAGIGVGVVLQFDKPGKGVEFCQRMEALLPAFNDSPDHHRENLARIAVDRDITTPDLQTAIRAIMCVHWLQHHGHLVPDEYNGTTFACTYKGMLINCERNPVTMDLDEAIPTGVDVTEIFQASNRLDPGLIPSIRTVVEHARRRDVRKRSRDS